MDISYKKTGGLIFKQFTTTLPYQNLKINLPLQGKNLKINGNKFIIRDL